MNNASWNIFLVIFGTKYNRADCFPDIFMNVWLLSKNAPIMNNNPQVNSGKKSHPTYPQIYLLWLIKDY